MKKFLPIAAAVSCGIFTLLDFFVPNPQIDAAGAILVEGVTILAAFALLLGLMNILAVHLRRLAVGGIVAAKPLDEAVDLGRFRRGSRACPVGGLR